MEESYLSYIRDFLQFHHNRNPEGLGATEVQHLLCHVSGPHHLAATLLYGSGLRLIEGLRLRVKDVDFVMNVLRIHDGKGEKDCVAVLSQSLTMPLRAHLEVALHCQGVPR